MVEIVAAIVWIVSMTGITLMNSYEIRLLLKTVTDMQKNAARTKFYLNSQYGKDSNQ